MKKREQLLLGLGFVLVGFLFVILLKTQGIIGTQVKSQETAVPSLIQTEQENQQLSVEIEKLQLELQKYAQSQSASTVANEQLQEAQRNAGLIGVTGPGVRITLDDSKRVITAQDDPMLFLIHEQYIREILNALWNGDAEAIAVNDQRMMTNTELFCSGSYIQINGTPQMPPYVIEAIGEPNTLAGALNFYGWFKLGDLQEQNGIVRKLEVLDKIDIPAGKMRNFRYAEPVKEGT